MIEIIENYKNKSVSYCLKLNFSRLNLIWKSMYLGFLFLAIIMAGLCLLAIIYLSSSILINSFFYTFLASTACWVVVFNKGMHITFKGFFYLYKKELAFNWKEYDFLRYLLFKKELIGQNIYKLDTIRSALQYVEIELMQPKTESLLKNPLISILIGLVIGQIIAILGHHKINFDFIAIVTLILLALMSYLIDQIGNYKKTNDLLGLKKQLKRAEFELSINEYSYVN